MTGLSNFFSEDPNFVVDPLWDDLAKMIRQKNAANPRHLQVELGPSEVGHPCMRRMAYGLMQVPRCNPEYDPLPSIFGTAMHTWLQSAAEYANEQLGRERWLTETRVTPILGLTGSSDLYDTDSQTVIDYKCLGYTSYDKYKANMSLQYKGQLTLYGKGFRNAGYPVKRIAIAILPRSGTLTKMHLWKEDYDDDFAERILARRESVITMIDDLNVDVDPNRYHWIPIQPETCGFCPWYRPEARTALQCSGKS